MGKPEVVNSTEEWRRFIRQVTISGSGLALMAALGSSWVGARLGPYILYAAAVAFSVLAVLNRHGWSQQALGNGLAAIGWGTSTALCVLAGGGIEAPSMILLPAVPAMAGFASGVKTARAWTVVVILTAMALFWLDPYIEPTQASEETVQGLQLIGSIGTALFIGVAVVSYNRTQLRQTQMLQAAIAAAEAARLTAEEARKQAELANRAKGAFLATMSHEIRTPLTAVVGVAEVLCSADIEEQHARQLDLLNGAGRTLLGLIDDVLDLSRIESGELELESTALDLHAVIDEVACVLTTHATTRGVRIISNHPEPLPVYGDPLRLRQILLNLIGNAVKFTKDGEVEVRCDTLSTSEDFHDLRLTVRDTGVGIAEAHLQLVFQPFTQAEQGTARRFGGSGLGLSIVTRLVEKMGGKVSIDSQVNKGTTVTVRLHLRPAPALPTRADLERRPSPQRLRVLLAEDNAVNQEVVSFMLEQCNCTVTVANNGTEAVEAVQQTGPPFHIVLMDCQMPDVDGFTATRILRAQGATVPIIALTANATPQVRAACIEAGMNGFASKPVTLEELRNVLARHADHESSEMTH